MYTDGKSILTVTQDSEYKNIDVFVLELNQTDEDKVSQYVTYRYHTMKRRA